MKFLMRLPCLQRIDVYWWRPFVRMVAINNRKVQLEIIAITRRFYFIKPSSLCGGGGIDIGIFML